MEGRAQVVPRFQCSMLQIEYKQSENTQKCENFKLWLRPAVELHDFSSSYSENNEAGWSPMATDRDAVFGSPQADAR